MEFEQFVVFIKGLIGNRYILRLCNKKVLEIYLNMLYFVFKIYGKFIREYVCLYGSGYKEY